MELPTLVLYKISNYLNLKEKAQLRLVNKKFSKLNLYNQNILCIHQNQYPLNLIFSFTNKLVGYENSTNFLNRKFYELKCNFPFEKIKKLYISSIWILNDLDIKLKKLNTFKSLEQLEINDGVFEDELKFNFKNLRILSLNNCKFNKTLELNCPLLEVFICLTEIKKLKFTYPLSLKYLELFEYHSLIKQFKNLESLALLTFKSIDPNILKDLAKLKDLNLNIANYMYLNLEEINLLKWNLEQSKLKVNMTFFKMSNCVQSKRVRIDHTNVNIVKNNYYNLENNLRWKFEVNYSSLIRTFNYSLPIDFFIKFMNIQQVEISEQVVDKKGLIYFLSNCKQLRTLHINELLMNQFPYDQLSRIRTLEELKISKSNSIISSYEFLNSLNSLKSLELYVLDRKIEFSFFIDFIFNALLRCRNLVKLFITKSEIDKDQKFILIKLIQQFYTLCCSRTKIEIIYLDLKDLIDNLFRDEFPYFLEL